MKSQPRLTILIGLVPILLAMWFIRSREIPASLLAIAQTEKREFLATLNVNSSTAAPRIDVAHRFESRIASSINQAVFNRQETLVVPDLSPRSQPESEGAFPTPNRTLITSPKNKHVTISGTVSIHGDLPPEKSLPLDPICSRAFEERFPGATPTTRFFVTDNGGLGDVLVTIIGL